MMGWYSYQFSDEKGGICSFECIAGTVAHDDIMDACLWDAIYPKKDVTVWSKNQA
jgi:hypothetical protein